MGVVGQEGYLCLLYLGVDDGVDWWEDDCVLFFSFGAEAFVFDVDIVVRDDVGVVWF